MGFNRRKMEDQRRPGRADLSTPRTVRVLRISANTAVPHAFMANPINRDFCRQDRQNKNSRSVNQPTKPFAGRSVVPIMSAERSVRRARAAIADEHRRRNADRAHTAGAWRIEGQLTRAAGSRLPRAYSQPWVAKSLFHMPMTASAAFSKSTCLAGAVSETIPVRV
jgi:hypothetical protein